MEPSELEAYENKLLPIIKNLRFNEELRSKTSEVIDYHSLELFLMKTSNARILKAFADVFFDGDRDFHLAEDIAKNIHATDTILDKLAPEGGYIGRAVARNSSTSTVTLLWIHKYSDDTEMTESAKKQLNQRKIILIHDLDIEGF